MTSLPFFYHVACRQSYTNLIYLWQQKYFIIPNDYILIFIIILKYYKNICSFHNYVYFIYNYAHFFYLYLYKNINFDSYILFLIEITGICQKTNIFFVHKQPVAHYLRRFPWEVIHQENDPTVSRKPLTPYIKEEKLDEMPKDPVPAAYDPALVDRLCLRCPEPDIENRRW